MDRLILTIDQARTLQRHVAPWPADWAFALQPEREKPDTLADPDRMVVALEMKKRGCTDPQIAEQLGWKLPSGAMNTVNRLHKRGVSSSS